MNTISKMLWRPWQFLWDYHLQEAGNILKERKKAVKVSLEIVEALD